MQPPDNFTYLIFVDHVLHTPDKPFAMTQLVTAMKMR